MDTPTHLLQKTSVEYFNEVVELEKQQVLNIQNAGLCAEEKHRLERELMDIKEKYRKARQLITETKGNIYITTQRAWTAKNQGL